MKDKIYALLPPAWQGDYVLELYGEAVEELPMMVFSGKLREPHRILELSAYEVDAYKRLAHRFDLGVVPLALLKRPTLRAV